MSAVRISRTGKLLLVGAMLAASLPGRFPAVAATALSNDFPTAARADYVFACMASNGQNQDMLHRCSCSIDVIASILPYERYVEAETVLRMRQLGGENAAIFRDTRGAKALVDELRGAQAEAEIRCF